MVTIQSKSAAVTSNHHSPSPPPPVLAIFVVYVLLGALLSFAVGRQPGTFPHDTLLELSPTIMVVCLFLTSYSLVDVMAVGALKEKYGLSCETYGSQRLSHPPEEVYLAQRVQTNQVEQLHGFLVASLSFSVLVNGKVGAALALLWTVLRRLYASTYRAAAGKPIGQAGLSKFTIPAYFVVNSMLMGTVVQCVRTLVK